jgi:hypothetical protein
VGRVAGAAPQLFRGERGVPGRSPQGEDKGNASAPERARKICWTRPRRPRILEEDLRSGFQEANLCSF